MDARGLFGTETVEDVPLQLKAGPITALFVAGALRDIRHSGVEVIRGLHFLIRDRNWSTLMPRLSAVDLANTSDGFRLTYAASGETASDGQTIGWTGTVTASPQGLRFEVRAEVSEDFTTCRTGFVVLHPLEKVAGCAVTVTHSNGNEEALRFPETVDPLQCFVDVTALSHEPLPGLTVTCRMEGGAWETEDHRNWMDASFKTYFRALALPSPYVVPAGEVIEQAVDLRFSGAVSKSASVLPGAPSVVLGDRTGCVAPQIGVIARQEEMAGSLAAIGPLSGLGLGYLVLRAATNACDLQGYLGQGAALARAAQLPVALEIVVANRDRPVAQEIDLVAIAARVVRLTPVSVAVSSGVDLISYPPSVDRPLAPPLAELYAATRAAFPGVPVGGGSLAFFPELNRNRPAAGQVDFLQWGTNSINHAADDLSVMETLETVPHQIRSARAMLPGTPLRIGPVNIAMPLNPYGKSQPPNPDRQRSTMTRFDPRHGAQFGAAFVAGYLSRVVQGGVGSVTVNSAAGDFGLFDPAPIPAAAVIARVAPMAGGAVLQAASSQPQRLLALAIEKDGKRLALLTNLTAEPLSVTVSGWPVARTSMLAAGAAEFTVIVAPGVVDLPAYGVACLEG